MPYIIEKMEDKFSDAISSPEAWIRRDPKYAGFFDSNRELQNQHEERGNIIKTPEWKHVASYMSPIGDVQDILKDGGWIKNKKAFYAWLSRNREYATYDIKFGR
jgi:hypothetical protein